MIDTKSTTIVFFYPTYRVQDLALLYSSNAVKDVEPFDPLTLTDDERYFFYESFKTQLTEVWAATSRLTYGLTHANFLLQLYTATSPTSFNPPGPVGGGATSTDAPGQAVEASGFTVRRSAYLNAVGVANTNTFPIIDSLVENVIVYGILADWYFNKQAPEAGKYYTVLARKSLTDLKNNLYELYKLPL